MTKTEIEVAAQGSMGYREGLKLLPCACGGAPFLVERHTYFRQDFVYTDLEVYFTSVCTLCKRILRLRPRHHLYASAVSEHNLTRTNLAQYATRYVQ